MDLNYSNQQQHDDLDWLINSHDNLTEDVKYISPSEWAESKRYLPPNLSPAPGFYEFSKTPYLKEIIDCLDIRNPVKVLTVKKGAQIGATVGILENAIGYLIDVVKCAPSMMITSDRKLAKTRYQKNIIPLLKHSGLESLIQSHDEGNERKTGRTENDIEWFGGGYLLINGAKTAAALRSSSIQFLFQDEVDSYPANVGVDGDPCELVEARTKAYHQSRKIVRISTPLITNTSRIDRYFKEGDQRHYYVPCLNCGEMQTLRFSGVDKDTGAMYGLDYEVDDKGWLVEGSVFYVCRYCGHRHVNADKTKMLAGGEWRPKATPKNISTRSYFLNGLYSPAFFYPWEEIVQNYLDAWDVKEDKLKSSRLYQTFYNNDLGKSYQPRGYKIEESTISEHVRSYKFNQIPNDFAKRYAGGPILCLTCAVDVHKNNLAVMVVGWTSNMNPFVISYERFKGDCEKLDDEDTWGRLEKLIDTSNVWESDDGCQYMITTTFIDAGWSNDLVVAFCKQYAGGVYPIIGRNSPEKNSSIREFSEWKTQSGTRGFRLFVDLYKDRLWATLRREWNGVDIQPRGHFNTAINTTRKQLKELTVEHKKEKINKQGVVEGVEWTRPSGVANEMWDLLIYNHAALDVIAWDVCVTQLKMDQVNWRLFWDMAEERHWYFSVNNKITAE